MTTTLETTKRFERSAAANLLIKCLADIADYAVRTYRELSHVAHEDVQKNPGVLATARRYVEKHHKKVFVTVKGVGLKLATDLEISDTGPKATQSIHRKAHRTRETMTVANLDNLTNEQKLAHMSNDAILGLAEHASRAVVQRRLEAEIAKTGKKILEAEELWKIGGLKQIT